jgi:hypothetical protein
MSENPIAKCDQCGRPIFYGNRPDGMPNGVGMVTQDRIVVNLCAECICKIGKTGEIPDCGKEGGAK